MKRLLTAVLSPLLLVATPAMPQGSKPLPIGTVHFVSSALSQMFVGNPLGSAFLVGPCHIVSAKHVAPRGRPIVGARLRFNAPGQSTGGTVIATGSNPQPWARGTTRRGDWIVAKLDRCLGNDLGWFRLSAAHFADTPQFTGRGAVLGVGGYPVSRDRAKGIVVSRDCAVKAVLPDGTIAAACRTDLGQSGGPMFVLSRTRGPLALGVISATELNGTGVYAAPVDEIVATLPELAEVELR